MLEGSSVVMPVDPGELIERSGAGMGIDSLLGSGVGIGTDSLSGSGVGIGTDPLLGSGADIGMVSLIRSSSTALISAAVGGLL